MKKHFLATLFAISIFLLAMSTVSFGACSASNKSVKSGETFTVSVSSSVALEDYGVILSSYSGLNYISCSGPSGSQCNPTTGKIGYADPANPVTSLGTFEFKAPEITEDKTFKIIFNVEADTDQTVTSTITVKAPAIVQTPTPTPTSTTAPEPTPATTPEPTPVITPEPTTTPEPTPVKTPEPEKKSDNANLSNLGIRPNDFTGFRSANTSYSVSVPYEVEKIEVYANKAEEKQSITGTGTKNLSEGSNPFDVVVTAEDGTQKTYKINVIRLAKEETNNPDVENPETKVELALASLQIVSVSLNEPFNPNKYEYTATANADAKEVIVSGSANVESALVDIDAPEEFEEGENIIKITVRDKEGENKKVYTIKVNKVPVQTEKEEENTIPVAVGSINNNNKNKKSNGTTSRETLIFCVGVAVVTLLGIIFAVIRYKKDNANAVEKNEFDFVGDISAKEAIIDAAVTTSKLSNASANFEVAEEGEAQARKKGKHF